MPPKYSDEFKNRAFRMLEQQIAAKGGKGHYPVSDKIEARLGFSDGMIRTGFDGDF